MVYLLALLIFVPMTALTWFAAVALFHLLLPGADLRRLPEFPGASAAAIALASLLAFVPFPAGFLLTLGAWWMAAWALLGLPLARAVALFALLAGLTVVTRLAVIGAFHI